MLKLRNSWVTPCYLEENKWGGKMCDFANIYIERERGESEVMWESREGGKEGRRGKTKRWGRTRHSGGLDRVIHTAKLLLDVCLWAKKKNLAPRETEFIEELPFPLCPCYFFNFIACVIDSTYCKCCFLVLLTYSPRGGAIDWCFLPVPTQGNDPLNSLHSDQKLERKKSSFTLSFYFIPQYIPEKKHNSWIAPPATKNYTSQ